MHRERKHVYYPSKGNSNDDKIMVVADPAIEGERLSPGGGSLDGP